METDQIWQPEVAGQDWAAKAESDIVDQEVEEETSPSISNPWNPDLIRVDSKPFSVKQVLEMIESGDLDLEPEFQRRRVWNASQKSLLIESILLRIPLPAFYFASDDQGNLQVIDGLQRLSTINEFVNGQSGPNEPKGTGFRLRKLEYLGDKLKGKTFDDLKRTIWAKRILQTSITANVVDPQTPDPVKFNIFGRLNKQGTPLSPQELRFAMSGSRLRKTLKELVNLDSFQAATGGTLKDNSRMHDLDIILRFCLHQSQDPTSSDPGNEKLADRLSKIAKDINDPGKFPDSRIAEIRLSLDRSMRNSIKCFGSVGFRKNEILELPFKGKQMPFNKAIFEVWSWLLSGEEIQEGQIEICRNLHNGLLKNIFFQDYVSLNTGDPKRVADRFKIARDMARAKNLYVK